MERVTFALVGTGVMLVKRNASQKNAYGAIKKTDTASNVAKYPGVNSVTKRAQRHALAAAIYQMESVANAFLATLVCTVTRGAQMQTVPPATETRLTNVKRVYKDTLELTVQMPVILTVA